MKATRFRPSLETRMQLPTRRPREENAQPVPPKPVDDASVVITDAQPTPMYPDEASVASTVAAPLGLPIVQLNKFNRILVECAVADLFTTLHEISITGGTVNVPIGVPHGQNVSELVWIYFGRVVDELESHGCDRKIMLPAEFPPKS